MTQPNASLALLILGLAASTALAQSYGAGEQVLTVGAAEFQARSAAGPRLDANGYVSGDENGVYLAPLALPEGARLERLCLYADDSDPSPAGFVDAFLVAAKLVPGGEAPAFLGVIQGTYSSSDVGYGYYCTDPFEYTLRGRTDLDEDDLLDAVAYYVWADVPAATQNSLALGGVQITWRRQVSVPSEQTFADVPSSDMGFGYIEALAASGITAGCSVTEYCPEATLTRRQMAVFLAKALGLHWTEATP